MCGILMRCPLVRERWRVDVLLSANLRTCPFRTQRHGLLRRSRRPYHEGAQYSALYGERFEPRNNTGAFFFFFFFCPTHYKRSTHATEAQGKISEAGYLHLMEWNAEPEPLEKLRPSLSSLTSLPIRSLSAVPLCIFR